MGQFMRVFYIRLHKNRHSKHSSVIIWQWHHDVTKLLFGSKVVKCWLFNKRLGKILKYFSSNLEGFVLIVNDNWTVVVLFWC